LSRKEPPWELVPGGRERKVDAELTRALAQVLAWGRTIEEACAYAGVSVTTYYEGPHRCLAFAEAMDTPRRVAFVLAKKVVLRMAEQVDDRTLPL
jgi:hypothetical protein